MKVFYPHTHAYTLALLSTSVSQYVPFYVINTWDLVDVSNTCGCYNVLAFYVKCFFRRVSPLLLNYTVLYFLLMLPVLFQWSVLTLVVTVTS